MQHHQDVLHSRALTVRAAPPAPDIGTASAPRSTRPIGKSVPPQPSLDRPRPRPRLHAPSAPRRCSGFSSLSTSRRSAISVSAARFLRSDLIGAVTSVRHRFGGNVHADVNCHWRDPLLGSPVSPDHLVIAGCCHGRERDGDDGAKLASPQTARPALMQEGPPSGEGEPKSRDSSIAVTRRVGAITVQRACVELSLTLPDTNLVFIA